MSAETTGNDIFTDKIQEWSETFFSMRDSLKVVISRKAPRLAEYCFKQKYGDVDLEKKREIFKNIVSDYALPFVLPKLNKCLCLDENDERKISNVMVCDEAIYFGSTFEMILSFVLSGIKLNEIGLSREKVYTLPAIITQEADRMKDVLNFPDIKDKNTNQFYTKEKILQKLFLKDEKVSAYVDNLLTQFQTLAKPADIEYPIIYFNIKKGKESTNSKYIKHRLEVLTLKLSDDWDLDNDQLEKPYLTEHWVCKKREPYRNYTLLLNKLSPRKSYIVSPDFRKIRIFFTDNDEKIALASFAPHSIPEKMLVEDCPLFEGTPLKSAWKEIYKSINRNIHNNEEGILYKWEEISKYLVHKTENSIRASLRWQTQLKEYEDFQNRSLVICANYLLSFKYLLDVSQYFGEIFNLNWEEEYPSLDIIDLRYLVGYDLAKEIYEILMPLLKYKETFKLPVVDMDPIHKHDYIPEDYQAKFYSSCREDFIFAKSVSELVSSNFSNQRREIEIASRDKTLIQKSRLNFGESYTTLMSKFSIYYSILNQDCDSDKKRNDLEYKLHKAMDFRIDNGSVVPKYIAVDGIYLRLFRAGENEDKYKDQLDRIIRLILRQVGEKLGNNGIPKRTLECIFALTMGQMSKEDAFINLGGIKFKTEFEKNNYKTYFNNGEIDVPVLEHAINSHLIKQSSDDENGLFTDYFIENGSSYVKYLDERTIVDEETEKLIIEYTDAAVILSLRLNQFALRDFLNWTNDWTPDNYLLKIEEYSNDKKSMENLYYKFPNNSAEDEMFLLINLSKNINPSFKKLVGSVSKQQEKVVHTEEYKNISTLLKNFFLK